MSNVPGDQISTVQKKWYARRYAIVPFNRAYEEADKVVFFFTVHLSHQFQVNGWIVVGIIRSSSRRDAFLDGERAGTASIDSHSGH